jgi:phosphatidyl-myo-inositol dimannoside synthase
VTSGLGTRYGGIGVVAQMIFSALEPLADVVVWEHPPFWPRLARIPTILWRVAWGSLTPTDLVIYDHVHLAVLHGLIPALKKVPYVVFLHGVEVWEPLDGRRRQALLQADLLLTNSSTTETEARKANAWLPKVEVAWLGVSKPSQTANVAASAPLALMVGRMVENERYKGHDEVLEAWPTVQAAVPSAKLVIIGWGNDAERLRRRAADSNLQGVEFAGRLTDAQRNEMYLQCRVLLLPSKGEGFGLAAVEAASFGVPVLGLAGTVTEELFPTGAILARNLDAASIAGSAVPLMADGSYAAEVGRAARTRVESVFLEEHFAERLRKLLSPVLPVVNVSAR